MTDQAPGGIPDQDEVLELLFWLEGEGFAGSATVPGMARFMAKSEDVVRMTLARLLAVDHVMLDREAGEYRLTKTGRKEAGRRFAEEFAPMLSQGHGECNDPTCDCHTNPDGAAECHARRHQGNHP